MFSHLLEQPWIYTFTQFLWYRPGFQKDYVHNWIKPRSGDRILDIGCGTGTLLELMPDVNYMGYDPNPRYIAYANKHFGKKGRFNCDYLTHISDEDAETVDIVLLNGVLHHVSDHQANQI